MRVRIQNETRSELLPFDEQVLVEMRADSITYANLWLRDKLGMILDCRSLVELAQEFETRIRQYYKPVFK